MFTQLQKTRHFVLCHQFVWPKISSARALYTRCLNDNNKITRNLSEKWKKMENNVGTFDKLISYKRKSFKRHRKILHNKRPYTWEEEKTKKRCKKKKTQNRVVKSKIPFFYLDFPTPKRTELNRQQNTRNISCGLLSFSLIFPWFASRLPP